MLKVLRFAHRGGVCRQCTRWNGALLTPTSKRLLATSTQPTQKARVTPKSSGSSKPEAGEASPPPKRGKLVPILIMAAGAGAVIQTVRQDGGVRQQLGGDANPLVTAIVSTFGTYGSAQQSPPAEQASSQSPSVKKSPAELHKPPSDGFPARKPSILEDPAVEVSKPATFAATSTASTPAPVAQKITPSQPSSAEPPAQSQRKSENSPPNEVSISPSSGTKSTKEASVSESNADAVGDFCPNTVDARYEALRLQALELDLLPPQAYFEALQTEAVQLGLAPDATQTASSANQKDGESVKTRSAEDIKLEQGLTALIRVLAKLDLDEKVVNELEKAYHEGLDAQRSILQREFDADATMFMEEAQASAQKWQNTVRQKFGEELSAVVRQKDEVEREKELLEKWRLETEEEVDALQSSWGDERTARKAHIQKMRHKILAMEDVFRWNSTNAFLASKISTIVDRLLVLEDALRNTDSDDSAALRSAFASLSAVAADDAFMNTVLKSVPAASLKSVPSVDLLKARFNRVEKRAREAIMSEDKGLRRHLLASLFSKLLVRERGHSEEDTADGRLSRAGYFLESGDIQRCVNELSLLEGLEGHLVSDWVRDAKRLLTVRQAVDLVRAQVTVESLRLG